MADSCSISAGDPATERKPRNAVAVWLRRILWVSVAVHCTILLVGAGYFGWEAWTGELRLPQRFNVFVMGLDALVYSIVWIAIKISMCLLLAYIPDGSLQRISVGSAATVLGVEISSILIATVLGVPPDDLPGIVSLGWLLLFVLFFLTHHRERKKLLCLRTQCTTEAVGLCFMMVITLWAWWFWNRNYKTDGLGTGFEAPLRWSFTGYAVMTFLVIVGLFVAKSWREGMCLTGRPLLMCLFALAVVEGSFYVLLSWPIIAMLLVWGVIPLHFTLVTFPVMWTCSRKVRHCRRHYDGLPESQRDEKFTPF